MTKHIVLCQYCSSPLDKDSIGLNKKLLESQTKQNRYSCLACLAEQIDCTEDELKEKIKEFKLQGCKLFV